jgi:hypothetical protein
MKVQWFWNQILKYTPLSPTIFSDIVNLGEDLESYIFTKYETNYSVILILRI